MHMLASDHHLAGGNPQRLACLPCLASVSFLTVSSVTMAAVQNDTLTTRGLKGASHCGSEVLIQQCIPIKCFALFFVLKEVNCCDQDTLI